MANSSSGNRGIMRKAQSIAESSLMLVAAVLFFLGIWRIGLWYNNDLAERQSAYQESRVDAGNDEIGQWPVYTRRPLTENWTLGGEEFPPPAQANIGDGAEAGRVRRGGEFTDCENSDRIEELLRRAQERQAEIEEPIKELEAQAEEFDRQAEEFDRQAEEFERLSNEQMQRYNDCLGNCDAQRAACLTNCDVQYENCASQCLPYLEQAQAYSIQAQDCRLRAQGKRDQSRQKREEAVSLHQEVVDLLNEADRLGRECLE